jgi:hypothetical protein
MSPLYQVILQQDGRPDEVRLHDRALKLGETFNLLGHMWRVDSVDDGSVGLLVEAGGATVEARFVCSRSEAAA